MWITTGRAPRDYGAVVVAAVALAPVVVATGVVVVAVLLFVSGEVDAAAVEDSVLVARVTGRSLLGERMMALDEAARTERKIKRLMRELDEIDWFMYGQHADRDRDSYAGALEQKRDDVVRAAVIHMHTAFENLLTEAILNEILETPHGRYGRKLTAARGQALARMVREPGSLGFDMKLNFAVLVGVFDENGRAKMKELNGLRNKCSHNWLLNVPVKRKKKQKGRAPRLLSWRGRDLHKVPVLKEFLGEFGNMYYDLLVSELSREPPPSSEARAGE